MKARRSRRVAGRIPATSDLASFWVQDEVKNKDYVGARMAESPKLRTLSVYVLL